jgi:hypothetical protein
VTRCIMGSVFSDYQEGAAIFGAVSPACGGRTKFALRSRLRRSEAIGGTEALRLALGPLRRDHHLLFYFSFAASASLVPLGCPASGAVGVGQWFVDYSALIHKLCKSTASFLATATTARFFEFLAPREAIFSP